MITTSCAVLLALLVSPSARAADDPPRDAAVDRRQIVDVWKFGGPAVREAAEQALLGSAAGIEAFVTGGAAKAQKEDLRASVTDLGVTGGPTLREAAANVLRTDDEAALRTFAQSGWHQPWELDQRLHVTQLIAGGGPAVRAAAQKALDSNDVQQLDDFIATGWQAPSELDQRQHVTQILAGGGEHVKAAAQTALDADNPDALTEFIDVGWAVASARDAEKSTITDLVGSAVASAQAATRETAAAKEAAARAAAAAAAAKAEAARAEAESQAANGNAERASAAARKAATAADKAASAAAEAIGASAAATRAARVAASAASRAAAAASRAGQAASDAYKAAGAAVAKAGQAGVAKATAEFARDVAKDAKFAASAADEAGKAARSAANDAGNAARGASADADAAAAAADRASRAAGTSSAEAERARKAAANARASAERAKRAADAASMYANEAAEAAFTARDAANDAAGNALAAADAAQKASERAADAAVDAKLATDHANAAVVAANAAVKAANAAAAVFDAARKADAERRAVAAAEGSQAAAAARAAAETAAQQAAWDADQATRRDAETNRLIAEVLNAGTAHDVAVKDARRVALNLTEAGGQWTKDRAVEALGGSDDAAVDFVRTGITAAEAQDNREVLGQLAEPDSSTGSKAMRAAAVTALAGSDPDVAAFLRKPDYPGRQAEQRTAVTQVLAAAQHDKNLTVVTEAQKALDDPTGNAIEPFLKVGQNKAAELDYRIAANRILADPNSGPELKDAAQIALDGSAGMLYRFLSGGADQAAERDASAAAHEAEMRGLLATGAHAAQTAMQQAQEAQEVAAKARGDATAAATYAQQAKISAGNASTKAKEADASADQAEESAKKAAASAKAARDAAASAEKAAKDAQHSAARAALSASLAADAAASAHEAASIARAAAVAAGKDAEAANKAADEAESAVKAKYEKEKGERIHRLQSCYQYINGPLPDKDAYRTCVEQVDMTPHDLLISAYSNGQACEWMFPNRTSTEFINCTRDVLDPAFARNQSLTVANVLVNYMIAYMEPMAKIMALGCQLHPACRPVFAVFGTVLQFFAPADVDSMLDQMSMDLASLRGRISLQNLRLTSMLESRLASQRVKDMEVQDWLLKRLGDGSCATSGPSLRTSSAAKAAMAPVPCGILTYARFLEPAERAQAFLWLEKMGGVYKGPPRRSYPAIDGWWNGEPFQLKETESSSVAAIVKYASKAERDAKKENLTGVIVFIHAPNVEGVVLGGPLHEIPTQGTIKKIYVLTKDGWHVFPNE